MVNHIQSSKVPDRWMDELIVVLESEFSLLDIITSNSDSFKIETPRRSAFSNFDPADSPATR